MHRNKVDKIFHRNKVDKFIHKKNIALIMCIVMGISIKVSTKVNADFKDGWINTDKGWSYYENGNIKTGWLNDKGDFYYLKDDGSMVTGWIDVDNHWYYMSELGSMETGWQKINGNWYFMQDSGEMKTDWLKSNDKWYYLNENGAMVTSTSIDGYYLGADGTWIEDTSKNDTIEDKDNSEDIIMKTEKSTYELGTKEIKVNITNNSKKEVYYGVQYEIERFENNKWIKVPFKEEQLFIQIAYLLEPGETKSQIISLSNLRELTTGKYRVVKLGGAWTAEFEIK